MVHTHYSNKNVAFPHKSFSNDFHKNRIYQQITMNEGPKEIVMHNFSEEKPLHSPNGLKRALSLSISTALSPT